MQVRIPALHAKPNDSRQSQIFREHPVGLMSTSQLKVSSPFKSVPSFFPSLSTGVGVGQEQREGGVRVSRSHVNPRLCYIFS